MCRFMLKRLWSFADALLHNKRVNWPIECYSKDYRYAFLVFFFSIFCLFLCFLLQIFATYHFFPHLINAVF
jgi:hypothetical protein